MSLARYVVGDVLEQLRKLPDDSVDLVFTSPPFLALRSYLPADHPDKFKEIGSEPTPGAFIDTLLDVTEECARVLAPHGSLCFELGDTYSGSGGAGGDYDEDGLRAGQPAYKGSAARKDNRVVLPDGRTIQSAGISNGQLRKGPGWPLDKSLCLVPELYRLALAYGVNPLTGRTTERWRVRNVVRWHRPNPPVGALGDKFRPSTSDVVVACKSRARYFDLDAVRVPHQREDNNRLNTQQAITGSRADDGQTFYNNGNENGAPPLDTWVIPTAPYKGSHYATFPPDLVVRPVKAMCPDRVCVVCGEPRRRIVGEAEYVRDGEKVDYLNPWPWGGNEIGRRGDRKSNDYGITRTVPTLGWTNCGHDSWRNGVVLDPFAGSGTVLAVATGHGRDAIGIDIDERNAQLALNRVGMFLTVEWPERVAS